MTPHAPSLRSLLLCWLALMGLTIALLIAGDPEGQGRLPLAAVAGLLAVALLKGRQILWVFLGLKDSTPGWKNGFLAALATIAGIVLICALLILAKTP